MGLDPRLTKYDNGPECAAARSIFGFDNTPERILITLTGLIACGTPLLPPPAGSVIVTQFPPISLCQWLGFDGVWGFTVGAGAQISLNIQAGPDPLGQAFQGVGPPENITQLFFCTPAFPALMYVGGQAIATWGPDI